MRQSNNLHKRIKSGILDHLNTNTTLGHLIKLIVLETTISRISKGFKYQDKVRRASAV